MIHEHRALRLELPFDTDGAACMTLSIYATIYQSLYLSVNDFISTQNYLISLQESVLGFRSISTIFWRVFAPDQE
jgi:hypothetical protein